MECQRRTRNNKAMTASERQKKYLSNPENKRKHRERVRLYNEKMRQARLFAKSQNIW